MSTPLSHTARTINNAIRAVALLVGVGGAALHAVDGSLDPNYGASGVATANVLMVDVPATTRDIAMQADGKRLLAGFVDGKGFVVRLQPSGLLDTAFSGDGFARIDQPSGSTPTVADVIGLQSDGKIIIGGTLYEGTGTYRKFLLTRFHADGRLDSGFGDDGHHILTTDPGRDHVLADLRIDADDRIIVCGSINTGAGSSDALVTRFTSDGLLDTDFASTGIKRFNRDIDYAYTMTFDHAGDVILGGSNTKNVILTKIRASDSGNDGDLDASFGNDGLAPFDWTSQRRETYVLNTILVAADGGIYVAGQFDKANTARSDINWAVAKLTTDGSVDSNWGDDSSLNNVSGDGQISIDWGASNYGGAKLAEAALQNDGKLLLCGFTSNDSDTPKPQLIRLTSAGDYDASFASDGSKEINIPKPNYSNFLRLLVDERDDRAILIGITTDDGSRKPAVEQFTDAGDYDTTLDGDGSRTITLREPGDDSTWTSTIDSQGRLVMAGSSGRSQQHRASVTRLLPNGNADTGFGQNGSTSLVLDDTLAIQNIYDIVATDDDGLLVAGAALADDSRAPSRIGYGRGMVARLLADGRLDPSFGDDGVIVAVPPGAVNSGLVFRGVTRTSTGRILAVGQQRVVNDKSLVVHCFNQNGEPVTSFADDGIFTYAAPGSNFHYCIAEDSQGRILVSGTIDGVGGTLLRLTTDGDLDTAFSDDGLLSVDDDEQDAVIWTMLVRSDDSIVLGGQADGMAAAWLVGPQGTVASGFPIMFDTTMPDNRSGGMITGLVASNDAFIGSATAMRNAFYTPLPNPFAVAFTAAAVPLAGFGTNGLKLWTNEERLGTAMDLTASADGTYAYLAGASDLDMYAARMVLNDDQIGDAPVITEGDSVIVNMDEDSSPTTFSLTLHATDSDTAATDLSWWISSAASHGAASVPGGNGSQKSISYTPEVDYFGEDVFQVSVSDGALADTITVTVAIASQPDDPTGEPEISFSVAGAEVANGATIDGPSLNTTSIPQDQLVIRVKNEGTANLALEPVAITGETNCSIELIGTQPSALAPSGQVDLTFQVSSVSPGSYSCTLSFSNSDGDENPTTFTIAGTTTDASVTREVNMWLSGAMDYAIETDVNGAVVSEQPDGSWTITHPFNTVDLLLNLVRTDDG